MGTLYVLEKTSTQTIRALEEMLLDAKAGRILGLAACVAYSNTQYASSFTGVARFSAVHARGMAALITAAADDVG
ncbi:MAG: hypothetical protein ACRCV9_15270 [Burkholderiaceae bacterium]